LFKSVSRAQQRENYSSPQLAANCHDNASNIERVAKTEASAGFLTNFCGTFVPGYMKGQSNFNFWKIAGKSAEFNYPTIVFRNK